MRLLLHAWCTAPILEGGAIKGAIFESKEGRHAVLAKVVVDTTGDADLIARAGAPCESDIDAGDIHHCMNTAFLIGGVEMERWLAFRYSEPDAFSAFMTLGRERLRFFEKPFVSWRNDVALFMGPRLAGYSVDKCRGPDGGRAAVARACGRSSRSVSGGGAGICRCIFDARRTADRRSPQPQACRPAKGDTAAMGHRLRLGRRDWRLDLAVAEDTQHLGAVRRAGAGEARQHSGRGPPRRLRSEFAHVPARDSAMLVHRPGRRRRRGARGRHGYACRATSAPSAIQRELLRQGAYLSPATEAALGAGCRSGTRKDRCDLTARHPEVAAQRPSKDTAWVTKPHPSRLAS